MRESIDGYFLRQLAEAGSYWGMRYIGLQKRKCTGPASEHFSKHLVHYGEVHDRALCELVGERNRCIGELTYQNAKLSLHGYSVLELLHILASITPSLFGVAALAVIALAPLYALSGLTGSESQYSQRSFIVIDPRTVSGRAKLSGDDLKADANEKAPMAPPNPPTNLRITP